MAECLEEVYLFLMRDEEGITFLKKADYELILSKLNMNDKAVRENCLRVFGEVYKMHQEKIWSMFKKDMPLKVKSLLEARFK
jgi:hypothetical protein